MSSNVGLTTPRGSGTSGYIQRNLSTLKPRSTGYGAPYPPLQAQAQGRSPSNSGDPSSSPHQRQPDQAILAHDRQREVEVKVFELRDRLEEGKEGEEMDEEEIERRCDELRRKLLDEVDNGGAKGPRAKALKPHQVHERAEAKIKESERLRRALGIKEGREGRAWEDGRGGKKGGAGEKEEEWRVRDCERGRQGYVVGAAKR